VGSGIAFTVILTGKIAMGDECEFLRKAGCCAGKYLCMAQTPRKRVFPETMGCNNPVENDCMIYAMVVRVDE